MQNNEKEEKPIYLDEILPPDAYQKLLQIVLRHNDVKRARILQAMEEEKKLKE